MHTTCSARLVTIASVRFSSCRSNRVQAQPELSTEFLSIEREITEILNNLATAPLGITQDESFRISIAGAQEKTALLFWNGQ
jgi:hypothetical protein